MEIPKTKKIRKRGRPQLHDRSAALQAALRIFWEHGYEGASFEKIIEAMNISPSSFYNSFGSKEDLYKAVVEVYIAGTERWFGSTLRGRGDTYSVFSKLVKETAVHYTDPGSPTGCVISLGGTHVSPGLNSIRDMFILIRALSERMMADRIDQGVENGDLPDGTDAPGLASFFGTVFRGMAVQARDGKTREQLLDIGQTALRCWPARPLIK